MELYSKHITVYAAENRIEFDLVVTEILRIPFEVIFGIFL